MSKIINSYLFVRLFYKYTTGYALFFSWCYHTYRCGIAKINELWNDINQGKIVLDFMQDEDLFHVSTYSNYEKNEKSKYDLSIISVSNSFLNSIENLVIEGRYIKIVENGETVSESTTKAWKKVWDMTYRGEICRLFTTDYEKVISLQHSVDGKAHCYLYIAVR